MTWCDCVSKGKSESKTAQGRPNISTEKTWLACYSYYPTYWIKVTVVYSMTKLLQKMVILMSKSSSSENKTSELAWKHLHKILRALSLSDLEFLQLSLLGGSVWSPMTSDVCHLLHLLQPLGQAQEPLGHLPQSGQCGAQLVLCFLQAALVGPPLSLSGVERSVLDLRYAPGDYSLSASQHRGEQRLAVWAVLLQELWGK